MSIRDDLKAYLDQELPAARAEEVRQAIEADPALQQEVRIMKLLTKEIQEEAKEPTVIGAEETLAAVRGKPTGPRRKLMLGLVGGLLAIMVIAAIGPMIHRMSGSNNDAQVAAVVPADSNVSTPAPVQDEVESKSSKAASPGYALRKPNAAGAGGSFASPSSDGGAASASPSADPDAPNPANGLPKEDGTQLKRTRIMTETNNSSGGASPTTSAPTAQKLAPGHRVIQSADLTLTVKDASAAEDKATAIVSSAGGFIESSNMQAAEEGVPTANLTVRVPVERFASVLTSLRALGVKKADVITGKDVTVEIADDDAKLRALRAEEDSYVTMLRNTKQLGQILEIKDRLVQVREQIGSMQSEDSTLKNQSALSTINLSLEEKAKAKTKPVASTDDPKEDTWASDTWATAVGGLSAAVKFLSKVVIFLFVYSPLWVPIGVLGWWMSRKRVITS
jgi:hypothetical protein